MQLYASGYNIKQIQQETLIKHLAISAYFRQNNIKAKTLIQRILLKNNITSQEICSLYDSGKTFKQIQAVSGIGRIGLSKIIKLCKNAKNLRVLQRFSKMNKTQQQIIKLYKTRTYTIKDLAIQSGVGVKIIKNILRENNICIKKSTVIYDMAALQDDILVKYYLDDKKSIMEIALIQGHGKHKRIRNRLKKLNVYVKNIQSYKYNNQLICELWNNYYDLCEKNKVKNIKKKKENINNKQKFFLKNKNYKNLTITNQSQLKEKLYQLKVINKMKASDICTIIGLEKTQSVYQLCKYFNIPSIPPHQVKISDSQKQYFTKEKMYEMHIQNNMSIAEIAKFLQCVHLTVKRKLNQFNIPIRKHGGSTIPQKQIIEFIKSINNNIQIRQSDRKIISPLQIDIVLPELKLAIEFNGSYWHSIESMKYKNDINFHYKKLMMVNQKGYRLINVWEDDWQFNKQKVKYIIKNAINNEQVFDFQKREIKIRLDYEDPKILLKNGYILKQTILPVPHFRHGKIVYDCGHQIFQRK